METKVAGARKAHSRTSADLREILFQQMDAVISGETEPQAAFAVARLSKEIVSTVRLEMDFAREMREQGKGDALPGPIPLSPLGIEATIEPTGRMEEPKRRAPLIPVEVKAVPGLRRCLSCRNPFQSEGAHNQVCAACKRRLDGAHEESL